ncbi:MAG: 2-C-methyl-D-erythritol 4-phosphate cytidylyltransferase [Eubacteriales bacterium]|nr:2-C-methyl-D-erythritol 4-phosphate cytidylyltransferase [Eubacteriales bacterium]
MAERLKVTAIVVAAGSGSRMGTQEKKQFMELAGMPLMAHSLKAFEINPAVGQIILVTGEEDLDRALQMCIKYGFSKVRNIVAGGDMRFRSVYNGLLAVEPDTDIVLIHDGARPLLTQEVIRNCIKGAFQEKACVAAVKEKNTIKTADDHGYAAETIDRSRLFEVQTPQAFNYKLICRAYYELRKTIEVYGTDISKITDDAVIVENMTSEKVAFVEGDYSNIKVTTPEDMAIAEALLKWQREKEGK